MKRRYLRSGDTLPDQASVVVRGGELNPDVLRKDASRHHEIYGTYGISVFALRGTTFDELAQQPPLVRFRRLTLMTVGAIRAAALRLEPTGRNDRHFTIAFDDLEVGIERLCSCDREIRVNPYHETDDPGWEGA